MTKTSNALFAAAAAGLLAASAASQHLGTYDPAALREFATSACAPAPASTGKHGLTTRTPSTNPRAGAVAADNVHRLVIERIAGVALLAKLAAVHASIVVLGYGGEILGRALTFEVGDDALDLFVRNERAMHAHDPAAPRHVQHVALA